MGPLCAGVVGDVSAAQVEQVPVRVMHQRAPLYVLVLVDSLNMREE